MKHNSRRSPLHASALSLAVAILGVAALPVRASADTPADSKNDLILLSGAESLRHGNTHAFVVAHLRFAYNYYGFHPYVQAGLARQGSGYVGVGIAYDFLLPSRFVLSVGTGPGYYRHEGDDPNLGYAIEFSSWAELSTVILNRRIGITVAHISNAHLGSRNPGTEAVGIAVHVLEW